MTAMLYGFCCVIQPYTFFFEILLFSLLQMILPGNRPTRPVLRWPGHQHVGAPDRDGDPHRVQLLAHLATLPGYRLHWLPLLGCFKVTVITKKLLNQISNFQPKETGCCNIGCRQQREAGWDRSQENSELWVSFLWNVDSLSFNQIPQYHNQQTKVCWDRTQRLRAKWVLCLHCHIILYHKRHSSSS